MAILQDSPPSSSPPNPGQDRADPHERLCEQQGPGALVLQGKREKRQAGSDFSFLVRQPAGLGTLTVTVRPSTARTLSLSLNSLPSTGPTCTYFFPSSPPPFSPLLDPVRRRDHGTAGAKAQLPAFTRTTCQVLALKRIPLFGPHSCGQLPARSSRASREPNHQAGRAAKDERPTSTFINFLAVR